MSEPSVALSPDVTWIQRKDVLLLFGDLISSLKKKKKEGGGGENPCMADDEEGLMACQSSL